MAQFINTNVASLTAQRNLNTSQGSLNTSLQRLSSGLRINSAKDDAAGLAISERFTSQIRGLNQAQRNANDGISLAQTAEGDLAAITNSLQRIRELSVQSANATNSASDRAALQLEVSELVSEIDRVAAGSAFNGVKLLDGNFSSQDFQVGANAGEVVSISSITSARASNLGQSLGSTLTGTSAIAGALTTGELLINGEEIIAGADAKSIATAINAVSGSTNVTAEAQSLTLSGVTAAAIGDDAAGTVTINGVTTATINLGTVGSANRAAMVAGINAISSVTGVVATDNGTNVDMVSADGGSVEHSLTDGGGNTTFADANTGLAAAATTHSNIILTGTGSDGIQITGTNPQDAGANIVALNSVDASLGGVALSLTSVATVSDANAAIATVDAALATVNTSRASLGAVQNRFESVVTSIQTTSENLSAARSRIRDTDFAEETASLTRSQILQQAGVAMLSQANSLPQNVLSLLQ